MSGWQATELEKLSEHITVGFVGTMAKHYKSAGVPFLRSKNILPFELNLDDLKYISEEFNEKISKSKLREKDVVIVRTGYPGIATVIPKSETQFNCSDLVIVRTNDKLDPYFLSCFLNTKLANSKIAGSLVGAAQKHFNVGVAKRLKIPTPKISEQRRISELIYNHIYLIENNQKRIKIFEEMAQRLYTEWFVNFRFPATAGRPGHENTKMIDSGTKFGMIPEGWEVSSLDQMTSYLSRGMSPKYNISGESLIINQRCIRNNSIDVSVARRQNKKISDDKQVGFGDVLINSTGVGTLGRVAQAYEDYENMTADTHVTILRPQRKDYIDYLGSVAYSLESEFVRLGAGATGQKELRRTDIGNIKILLPTDGLLKRYSDLVSPFRFQKVNLKKSSEKLSTMRDLLIEKLVTGRRLLKS